MTYVLIGMISKCICPLVRAFYRAMISESAELFDDSDFHMHGPWASKQTRTRAKAPSPASQQVRHLSRRAIPIFLHYNHLCFLPSVFPATLVKNISVQSAASYRILLRRRLPYSAATLLAVGLCSTDHDNFSRPST